MRLIDADYYCDSICISNRNNCNKNLCPLNLAPTVDAALGRRPVGRMNLIDKDALVEKLISYAWNEKVSIEVIDMICGFPPAQPTINAAPVVHGRWHFDDFDGDGKDYTCSVCGWACYSDYDYCPNCGAKMDEVSE